jgi:hypothetical protein
MAISRMRLFNIFFGKLPDLISDVKGAILIVSASKAIAIYVAYAPTGRHE